MATEGYAAQFLQHVWRDAIGYCGSELIRRTIGLAHVADLDSIDDQEMRRACQRHALSLGRALIWSRHMLMMWGGCCPHPPIPFVLDAAAVLAALTRLNH